MEQWLVTNKRADFKEIGAKFHIDQVTARIIRNRDLVTDEEIRTFLSGTVEDLHNPHELKDADRLVDILMEKIQNKKAIRIIGDYDIDGVMSTYILKSALTRCNANVDVKIPNRITDGYGLNVSLIEDAHQDGIDTILTCDNGIAAMNEIALAKKLEMTVLVTDHHEIPFVEEEGKIQYLRSEADAIVNPHQKECNYPFKYLCGAGVAWKVVCILFERLHIPFEEAEEYLENVAFATVGDVMDLVGENRILVKEGIKRIRTTNNIGMRALIAQSGIEQSAIMAFHFGFVLGPCVNASGRLDTAKRALELFFETDEKKATEIANELVVLNIKRKELTADAVEAAKEICESKEYKEDKVLVVFLPDVHESIAGIVAGRIREAYHKPVFVLTKGAEGVKGSGRSIEEYSMYEELCKCRDLLTKFGGHPMAAGLSLEEENIDLLRQQLNANTSLTEKDLIQKIKIDVPMPVGYVTMDLVNEFSILEPFGKGNAKPVFADKNLSIVRMWEIGKARKFWKMTLKDANGMSLPAVYFGDSEKFVEYLKDKYGESQVQLAMAGRENDIQLSVVYYPKINSYMGTDTLQFEIQNYC